MKTVRDIFAEALALKVQGVSTAEIKEQIIQMGEDNGLAVTEQRTEEAGRPITFGLHFSNGEVISFDGTDWHHNRK